MVPCYLVLYILLFIGFNPVWEETLTFTIHMPEIAMVRFLVWDHDPIGRDFVGQRTVTFSSLMPGESVGFSLFSLAASLVGEMNIFSQSMVWETPVVFLISLKDLRGKKLCRANKEKSLPLLRWKTKPKKDRPCVLIGVKIVFTNIVQSFTTTYDWDCRSIDNIY